MSYKVRLESFEGPFDLLVYLIENAQMSIYDINIADITGQYLDYVREIQEIDIETAAQFMVLAAHLIEIKSKMILPKISVEGETILEDDPRSQLVERLLEYKKFKKAAELLTVRFDETLRAWEKPQEDISAYTEEPDEYLSLDMDSFVKSFNLFLIKKQRVDEVRNHYTRIEREKASIESRIAYISQRFIEALNRGKKRIPMLDLVPDRNSKYDVVVTFVSALQMIRDKDLEGIQNSLYGDIILEVKEKTGEQQENN